MRIAVDAMGGDFAPEAVVEGAVLAARHGVPVVLAGRREAIAAALSRHPDAGALPIDVIDAGDVVEMGDPASCVLREKRGASVRAAADAVARGEAAALFSAGHTGATVLAARTAFGLLPGAERPALAATIPTLAGAAVLIDVGANAECRPAHLVHFAAMGRAFARVALGVPGPRVALLSIGEEASKGNELTREAHRLLRASSLPFAGNLEARDVFTGRADVIVCDGFTGNVVLKVSEGLVETVEQLLRDELSRTFSTRVGFLLSRRAFRRFRRRLDAAEYGAVPLLGVAGLCLVGHGRSSPRAVRNGIVLAARFARDGMLDGVRDELAACAAQPAVS
jgi:glycerol-3-phosphate acyltransferase PlsX